jgi:hypothetical protein
MRSFRLGAKAAVVAAEGSAVAKDDEQAPERELDGLLLALEPGAVRVRRQPRLTRGCSRRRAFTLRSAAPSR